jgi:hypothetical protein
MPELILFSETKDGSFSITEKERIDLTDHDVRGEDMNPDRVLALHDFFQVRVFYLSHFPTAPTCRAVQSKGFKRTEAAKAEL